MFGVVPKKLWSRLNTPDEDNMCTWAMRCLLIEEGERRILIDTGIGDKQDEKFRSHFSPHGDDSLYQSLQIQGLGVEDITDVFLTHMHFDHVGGAVRKDSKGNLVPTFPNATYWTNELHLHWALNPNPRERASFLKENIVPLQEHGVLKYIDVEQGVKFTDSISVDFVNLETMKERAALYEKVVNTNHHIFFEHDKDVAMGQLVKNEKGRVVFDKETSLKGLI